MTKHNDVSESKNVFKKVLEKVHTFLKRIFSPVWKILKKILLPIWKFLKKILLPIWKLLKTPYMLVVPAFIFYAVFWASPVVSAVREVFTDFEGNFSIESISLLWTYSTGEFSEAFINTIYFAVISIILQFFLALGLALLINRNFKGSSMFLFIMMIPMAIPLSAVGIIWNTGFTDAGWINSIIHQLRIDQVLEWLGVLEEGNRIVWKNVSGLQAVSFLILVDTWTVLPSIMIIILAGLQNLNKEYSEAALVFGANRFQTVKDIVVPIIKPTIITALLLRIISGVQVWLISVIIFGHNLPFLVERIVFYKSAIFTDESEKLMFTYSLLVVVLVMCIAVVFLMMNKDQRRNEA